jgi:hypothetical protein
MIGIFHFGRLSTYDNACFDFYVGDQVKGSDLDARGGEEERKHNFSRKPLKKGPLERASRTLECNVKLDFK